MTNETPPIKLIKDRGFDSCSAENDEEVVRHPFDPISFGEFTKDKPLSWIIKKILPRAELAVIFGEPGSGKSFFGMEIGLCIARETTLHGYKVKRGRVVYVCAEGASGFRSRLKAYALHHNLKEEDFASFSIIPNSPNFLDDTDPEVLVSTIGKADVVIFDTFARITAGGNENDGKDMGPVLARCQMLHKKLEALIILIHHSGKDTSKGSRGWSGIKGAADTEIEVTKSGNNHKAYLSKQKDGKDGFEMTFQLIPIPIGFDDDQEEITSCYYEAIDAPSKPMPKRKLGGWQAAIMKAFDDLTNNESKGWIDEEILINEVIKNSANPPSHRRDTRPQVIRTALTALYTNNLLQSIEGKVTKKQ